VTPHGDRRVIPKAWRALIARREFFGAARNHGKSREKVARLKPLLFEITAKFGAVGIFFFPGGLPGADRASGGHGFARG